MRASQSRRVRSRLAEAICRPFGEKATATTGAPWPWSRRTSRPSAMLEAASATDPDLAAAWRDRVNSRMSFHRAVLEHLEADGDLADGWTVDTTTALFHAVTVPGVWRELTQGLGWTPDQYIQHLTALLNATFVRP